MSVQLEHLVYGQTLDHARTGYITLARSSGLSDSEVQELHRCVHVGTWLTSHPAPPVLYSLEQLKSGKAAFAVRTQSAAANGAKTIMCHFMLAAPKVIVKLGDLFSLLGPETAATSQAIAKCDGKSVPLQRFREVEFYRGRTSVVVSDAIELPPSDAEPDCWGAAAKAYESMRQHFPEGRLTVWLRAILFLVRRNQRVVLTQTSQGHLEQLIRLFWLATPLAHRARVTFSTHIDPLYRADYRLCALPADHRRDLRPIQRQTCFLTWQEALKLKDRADALEVGFAQALEDRGADGIACIHLDLQEKGASFLLSPAEVEAWTRLDDFKRAASRIAKPAQLGSLLTAMAEHPLLAEQFGLSVIRQRIRQDLDQCISSHSLRCDDAEWGQVLLDGLVSGPRSRAAQEVVKGLPGRMAGALIVAAQSQGVAHSELTPLLRSGVVAEMISVVPAHSALVPLLTALDWERAMSLIQEAAPIEGSSEPGRRFVVAWLRAAQPFSDLWSPLLDLGLGKFGLELFSELRDDLLGWLEEAPANRNALVGRLVWLLLPFALQARDFQAFSRLLSLAPFDPQQDPGRLGKILSDEASPHCHQAGLAWLAHGGASDAELKRQIERTTSKLGAESATLVLANVLASPKPPSALEPRRLHCLKELLAFPAPQRKQAWAMAGEIAEPYLNSSREQELVGLASAIQDSVSGFWIRLINDRRIGSETPQLFEELARRGNDEVRKSLAKPIFDAKEVPYDFASRSWGPRAMWGNLFPGIVEDLMKWKEPGEQAVCYLRLCLQARLRPLCARDWLDRAIQAAGRSNNGELSARLGGFPWNGMSERFPAQMRKFISGFWIHFSPAQRQCILQQAQIDDLLAIAGWRAEASRNGLCAPRAELEALIRRLEQCRRARLPSYQQALVPCYLNALGRILKGEA